MPLPGKLGNPVCQPGQAVSLPGYICITCRVRGCLRIKAPRWTCTFVAELRAATSCSTRRLAVAVVANTADVVRQTLQHLTDAPVVRPEVVSPVGDAMCLVDDQQAYARGDGLQDRQPRTHHWPARPLLGQRQMVVVDAVALEHLEPGRAFHVLAAVLVPGDVELGLLVVAQHLGGHEGADVQAHAVVEVGVPADGLLGQRLPAHEDVVGLLAFQDEFQAALQVLCCGQAGGGAVDAVAHAGFLVAYPVAQVGVDEALQVLGVELVVVHQRGEAVLQAVPHVPDEGAVVEALGVLLEELVAQPHVQALAGAVGIGQQLVEHRGLPAAGLHGFPGGNQQLEQAVVGGRSPRTEGRQTMPSSSVCSASLSQRAIQVRASSASSIAVSVSAGQR
jgi:hypothetical protein